jgi:C1A family cysteine protease
MGWFWGGTTGGELGWYWPGSEGGPLGGRKSVGLGYHPDLPDLRDYRLDVDKADRLPESVIEVLSEIKIQNAERYWRQKKRPSKAELKRAAEQYPSYLLKEIDALPAQYDLRCTGHFTPVEDQGELGSCTSQAVIGMVEYLMRAGGAVQPDMSRMFLYKTTRRLLGWSGDTGAYLRTTIKAMALFGVPPEHEWPYHLDLLDKEPDAYHYSFAQNFKALAYARLDGYGDEAGGSTTLDTIKRTLADGFPVAFGFPVYSSISSVSPPDYIIPYPKPELGDKLLGGHAVLAVGYDDNRVTSCDTPTDKAQKKGVIVIRNSWSQAWGEGGYAYLPYEYVTGELAVDFWSIFNKDWIRLGQFQ